MIRQFTGWLHWAIKHPGFALRLLRCRLDFFLRRKLVHPCVDPRGFPIDSPEILFTWWSLFVERQLLDPVWTKPLASAQSPRIIDVGANAGVFTHLVLGINPSAGILAVEPQPELAQRISQYASRSGKDVQCKTVACSDHSGQATLFFSSAGDVRASLDPEFAEHKQQISVPVTTVDALAPEGEIFMLKIDAEGQDVEVLKGAIGTVQRTQFVLIECHQPETLSQAKSILSGLQCKQVGRHDYVFFRPRLNV